MSHFTCLVIGDDVDAQLAPFHEFECTGDDNEYVQTLDRTAEALAEYESSTARRLRDPDGGLHPPYDDRFYREPTREELDDIGPLAGSGGNAHMSWHSKDWQDGRGYRAKVRFVPDGWGEVEVPVRDLEPFAEWAAGHYGVETLAEGESPDLADRHKYGYILTRADGTATATVYDRTNPNKKWDWWTIGGRWSGFFLTRDGARVDQARKGDIDFEAIRYAAGVEARLEHRKAHAAIASREIPNWQTLLGENPTADHIDAMRKVWNSNPVIRDLSAAGFHFNIEQYDCPEDEYATRASANAIRTHAVAKDGQWYEHGEMGWWGVVHDAKDDDQWNREFASLIDGLPDDTLLTVVDCHI